MTHKVKSNNMVQNLGMGIFMFVLFYLVPNEYCMYPRYFLGISLYIGILFYFILLKNTRVFT